VFLFEFIMFIRAVNSPSEWRPCDIATEENANMHVKTSRQRAAS